MPKIDLFASRLSHQLPQYFAWRPDPFSQRTDALQQFGAINSFMYFPHALLYAFALFYKS